MPPEGFVPLDPRIVQVRQIVGLVNAAVFGGLTLFALGSVALTVRPTWTMAGLGAVGWLMATVAMAVWLWMWPSKAYTYASYRLDADGLEIRRGVVFRRVINLPRSRVQHTDVSQGPIERSYGLSTLIVHTAGSEHARVALVGLSREEALSLRDQLLPRDGRDAV